MAKVKIEEILKIEEDKKRANENKFIPKDDGNIVKVFFYNEDPDELPVGDKGQYMTYQFRVKKDGEEKDRMFGLFPNQVVDLVAALKNHRDRVVGVMLPKGSKKLIFS